MVHNYKGYSYVPEKDYEEDNVKIFHHFYAVKDGIAIHNGWMPLSPYAYPSEELFCMWIDCGMPTSEDMKLNGNARHDDIVKYYNRWLDDKIDNEILGDYNG